MHECLRGQWWRVQAFKAGVDLAAAVERPNASEHSPPLPRVSANETRDMETLLYGVVGRVLLVSRSWALLGRCSLSQEAVMLRTMAGSAMGWESACNHAEGMLGH